MILYEYDQTNAHGLCLQALPWAAAASLPRKKMKRASYEGYEPDGIIKTNWVTPSHSFLAFH
jgi:hypothetical protein